MDPTTRSVEAESRAVRIVAQLSALTQLVARAGYVRCKEQLGLGQLRLGQLRLGQLRLGQLGLGQAPGAAARLQALAARTVLTAGHGLVRTCT